MASSAPGSGKHLHTFPLHHNIQSSSSIDVQRHCCFTFSPTSQNLGPPHFSSEYCNNFLTLVPGIAPLTGKISKFSAIEFMAFHSMVLVSLSFINFLHLCLNPLSYSFCGDNKFLEAPESFISLVSVYPSPCFWKAFLFLF